MQVPLDNDSGFDYSAIPVGYYDKIADRRKGVRSFWHYLKFRRIIDTFGTRYSSILDVGCFAGTFLGLISESTIGKQVGIDILESQIDYANQKYGNKFRQFYLYKGFHDGSNLDYEQFDIISCIEVIEHLKHEEIISFFNFAFARLKPGGCLLLTTPNYLSLWPLQELFLNLFSDVSYQEQHLTRFYYFNAWKKLCLIDESLKSKFRLELKTTTHMITPYISIFSFKLAEKISSAIPPRRWKVPFGSIMILKLQKL